MERQYVGIDLHRRRSTIVRMDEAGEVVSADNLDNDPIAIALEVAKAGPDPEVAVEATYGWYWLVDALQDAGANVRLAHSLGVRMREADVVPELDAWLARIFDPEHLDETCHELASASDVGDVDDAALEAARRKLDDCDTRLDRYRLALESGTDPAVVSQWIREVQGERLRAEQALASAARDELDVDQVRALIEGLGPIASMLDKAKPAKKAELYASLGLQLTYRPAQNLVAVEAALVACAKVRVGGGT